MSVMLTFFERPVKIMRTPGPFSSAPETGWTAFPEGTDAFRIVLAVEARTGKGMQSFRIVLRKVACQGVNGDAGVGNAERGICGNFPSHGQGFGFQLFPGAYIVHKAGPKCPSRVHTSSGKQQFTCCRGRDGLKQAHDAVQGIGQSEFGGWKGEDGLIRCQSHVAAQGQRQPAAEAEALYHGDGWQGAFGEGAEGVEIGPFVFRRGRAAEKFGELRYVGTGTEVSTCAAHDDNAQVLFGGEGRHGLWKGLPHVTGQCIAPFRSVEDQPPNVSVSQDADGLVG